VDELTLNATAIVPEDVVFRTFEDETLLLNLGTGQYHGLNSTGGRLLELLGESGAVVRDAIGQLADEYDMAFDDIAPDLVGFCADLEQRGLIRLDRAD
jgi:Coenzyme PQQ synthesis protein D (PqqD)